MFKNCYLIYLKKKYIRDWDQSTRGTVWLDAICLLFSNNLFVDNLDDPQGELLKLISWEIRKINSYLRTLI